MSVRVRCPGCDSPYHLPDQLAGKTVRCKSCDHKFKVPGAVQAAASKNPDGKSASKHKPAPPPMRKPDRDEAVKRSPTKAKALAHDDDGDSPRRPSKRRPEKRKQSSMPILLLAICIGGVLILIGGAVGAYFVLFNGPTTVAKADPSPKQLPAVKLPGTESPDSGKVKKGGKGAPKEELPNDEAIAADAVSYVKHVQPILKKYCTGCHSNAKPRSGANLSTYDGLMSGGNKQGPPVVAGEPDNSFLVLSVERKKQPYMPQGKNKSLTANEKTTLRNWVAAGAKNDAADYSAALPIFDRPIWRGLEMFGVNRAGFTSNHEYSIYQER